MNALSLSPMCRLFALNGGGIDINGILYPFCIISILNFRHVFPSKLLNTYYYYQMRIISIKNRYIKNGKVYMQLQRDTTYFNGVVNCRPWGILTLKIFMAQVIFGRSSCS